MIDYAAVIRAFVASRPKVQALAGDRVWAGQTPPSEYRPSDGPAVLLGLRGGNPDYSGAILQPMVLVQAFGLTDAAALAMDRAVYDEIHEASSSIIRAAYCEVLGQLLTAPSDWPVVISTYSFKLANKE